MEVKTNIIDRMAGRPPLGLKRKGFSIYEKTWHIITSNSGVNKLLFGQNFDFIGKRYFLGKAPPKKGFKT